MTVSGKNPPRIKSPLKNCLEDKPPADKIPPKIPRGWSPPKNSPEEKIPS